MSDRETPYGDDSDYLRKLAYKQEAEAVREDLVNYFSSSSAMDGFRTKLEEMIDQSLRTAVNEAMKDRNIQDTIRNELVTAVISKMKEEILKSQPTIISSVREGVLDKLTTTVRADIAKIYQQARDAQVNRDMGGIAKAQGESVATSTAGAADASAAAPSSSGTPPVVPPQKPPIRITLPTITLTRQSLQTGGMVFLLILVAVLITYYVVRPKEQQTQDPEATPTAAPINNGPETPAPLPVQVETLDQTWTRILNEAGSVQEVQELEQPSHLQCWFDSDTQRRLDGLLDPGTLPLSWRFPEDLFDSCVNDYAFTLRKYLPILASQITVHKLLQAKKKSGWSSWCSSAPEPSMPALRDFADGAPGGTTSNILNIYLTCAGLSSQPRIDNGSPSQDYLVTLYAALKDLGRR